jgi:hypothetical protein
MNGLDHLRRLCLNHDASRLELLLGDIRDAFAKEGEAEIASADLVKALVAIEGRSWAEMGKARKPMTQNMLARIRPEMTADKQESE